MFWHMGCIEVIEGSAAGSQMLTFMVRKKCYLHHLILGFWMGLFHQKSNPMVDLHFYRCCIGIFSMVWASFDVRIQSKNDPRTALFHTAQFLSMLESLFEKEAKRMEIDMKARRQGESRWVAAPLSDWMDFHTHMCVYIYIHTHCRSYTYI